MFVVLFPYVFCVDVDEEIHSGDRDPLDLIERRVEVQWKCGNYEGTIVHFNEHSGYYTVSHMRHMHCGIVTMHFLCVCHAFFNFFFLFFNIPVIYQRFFTMI